MNNRKKRCTNPACRKTFSYAPGSLMLCPWCGTLSKRDGSRKNYIGAFSFHFGVDATPASLSNHCCYDVRLERIAVVEGIGQKLKAIKAYRNVMQNAGLKESKEIIDGIWDGKPHVMRYLTADQVMLLMREGYMDISVKPRTRKRAKAVAVRDAAK